MRAFLSTGYPGTDEHLEQNLRIELDYVRTNDFYLGAQLALTDLRKPALSMGLGYIMAESLVLRCGLKIGQYLSWSFGIGAGKGSILVDLGFSRHTILGLSAACTVSYKIEGA